MILFVDLEHTSAHDQPHGELILAARTRITYKLQDIARDICLLQHYSAVDLQLIEDNLIRAVFLSGSSTDPDRYGHDLDGVKSVIRSAEVPVFGFCGGFQFMMESHGSALTRIGPLDDGETTEYPDYMPGWKTETGYRPVELLGDHDLIDGLGESPVFRHFHGWEVKELPDGFENHASTQITTVQLAISDQIKQVGTQFHPEYFTDEHPDGRRLIENFCDWVGLFS